MYLSPLPAGWWMLLSLHLGQFGPQPFPLSASPSPSPSLPCLRLLESNYHSCNMRQVHICLPATIDNTSCLSNRQDPNTSWLRRIKVEARPCTTAGIYEASDIRQHSRMSRYCHGKVSQQHSGSWSLTDG